MTASPKIFFSKKIPPRFRGGKSLTLLIGFSLNTSGSYRKNQKPKNAVVKPPINPSPINFRDQWFLKISRTLNFSKFVKINVGEN